MFRRKGILTPPLGVAKLNKYYITKSELTIMANSFRKEREMKRNVNWGVIGAAAVVVAFWVGAYFICRWVF